MRALDETPRIIAALQHVDSTDREAWVRVGMAIRGELGEAGFPIWDEWSRTAPNYNERDASDVWRSFGDSGPVGLGSLFHLAKENGWSDTAPRRELSPEEVEARRKSREEAEAKDREERQRVRAQAARWAAELLAGAPEANGHAYLDRKALQPVPTFRLIDVGRVQKLTGWTPKGKAGELQGNLLAARCVRPGSGVAVTLELIDADGRKAGLPGRGTRTGAFWPTSLPLPKPGEASTVLLGEGIATTLSGTQTTGLFGAAALSASNLKNVALGLRRQYPNTKIIILADLDRATGQPDPHAIEAARTVGGYLAVPDFGPGREPSDKDVNDVLVLRGPEAVKACIERAAPVEREQGEQPVPTIWDNPADIRVMLNTEPEPMAWLVKDRIPLGRGGIFTGVGGSSKTTMLSILGVGCITGTLPFSEWEIQRTGKAVLVLSEDTTNDIHDRLHHMCRGMTTSEREAIAHDLIAFPLAGVEAKLLHRNSRGVLERGPLFHSLVEKIKTIGDVAFVGLDPALSLSDGDESDQSDQRALGRMADDLAVQVGATCVLVTHAAKGLLSAEELDSHSSRGGGAVTDAGRFEVAMRTMTKAEAKRYGIEDMEERQSLVQVALTKGNRIPPSAKVPVWLRRVQGGCLVSADIQPRTPTTELKLTAADRLAMTSFKEASMEYGILDGKGRFAGLEVDAWREVFYDMSTADKPATKKKAFSRARENLVAKGYLTVSRDVYNPSGPTSEIDSDIITEAIKARRNIPEGDRGTKGDKRGHVPACPPSLQGDKTGGQKGTHPPLGGCPTCPCPPMGGEGSDDIQILDAGGN